MHNYLVWTCDSGAIARPRGLLKRAPGVLFHSLGISGQDYRWRFVRSFLSWLLLLAGFAGWLLLVPALGPVVAVTMLFSLVIVLLILRGKPVRSS